MWDHPPSSPHESLILSCAVVLHGEDRRSATAINMFLCGLYIKKILIVIFVVVALIQKSLDNFIYGLSFSTHHLLISLVLLCYDRTTIYLRSKSQPELIVQRDFTVQLIVNDKTPGRERVRDTKNGIN